MIGTTGAAVLVVINVLFASMLGIVAGGLSCAALRQSWSLRVAAIDAAFAAVVAVAAAYSIPAIESARGVSGSVVTLGVVVSIAGVVIRHFVRFALRPVKQ